MSVTKASPCAGCNGTGQITYFGGVSRFQFSYEECPECSGTGFSDQPTTLTINAAQIAANSGLSSDDAEKFLTVLAQTLCNTLGKKEKIQLRGFASFTCTSTNQNNSDIHFSPARQLLL